ncbi:Lipoprotein [Candida maltosa Xu316]|uniref:Lipoprotein n=1 Tax=Candida maltosa (strain Xu316) TaxID=1245528 RepID=M3K3I3_CANMX|nr:Lipoprotein [Candida maltosa Xu316]
MYNNYASSPTLSNSSISSSSPTSSYSTTSSIYFSSSSSPSVIFPNNYRTSLNMAKSFADDLEFLPQIPTTKRKMIYDPHTLPFQPTR